MFAMPRLRLLGALVIGSALVALLTLAAFSSSASANHSWNDYHWARTANPFTLKLGDNVSSTWDAPLADASADWSQSAVLDTMVVSGNVTNPKDLKKCPPTIGRVEVCNAKYSGNWLGLATIWLSGSHILRGTAKMNERYFNSEPYNTDPWRQLVMCQEVAHTFGLDHQDENFDNTNLGTCMDYTNDPSTNQHPNQHDYDELEIIYSHLDSTTTVGSATDASKLPPEANQGSFNSKSEWGRKIKESRNGKLELWKRDFGNGFKLITWVIRP